MSHFLSERPNLMRRTILLLFVSLIAACSTQGVQIPALEKNTQVTIFLPGFKGSILENKNGEARWITLSDALIGRHSLALRNEKLGISNEVLVATSVLSNVTVVPKIFEFDIYGDVLQRLTQKSDVTVPLYYDWRLDFLEHVKRLAVQVDSFKAQKKAVRLVGHSFGGIIVAYYLRYGIQDVDTAIENWHGASLVQSAILLGAPFNGALEMLHDMQYGDWTILNRSLLTAEALSSFPSSYQLLPRDEIYIESAGPAIFNVNVWKENHWGLFDDEDLSKELVNTRSQFVADNLLRAKKLGQLLHAAIKGLPPSFQLLNVIGIGHKTVHSVAWDARHRKINFGKNTVEDGDGVVMESSATLPGSFALIKGATQIRQKASHLGLLKLPAITAHP